MQIFTDVHRWASIKMVNYIVRPRKDHSVVLNPDIIETLDDLNAIELYANGAEARISFLKTGLGKVLSNEAVRQGPLCFVTLTPACCAQPINDWKPKASKETKAILRRMNRGKHQFDQTLKQLARQALGQIPFVGMIEAALYYRWKPGQEDKRDWVSWHCHLITWGHSQEAVSLALGPFRKRHSSMLDGPSAHVKEVREGDLSRQITYMMKSPQKMTKISYYPRQWTNPKTGEVRSPGFRPDKFWLQTGHRIRLADIMGHRRITDLFFGNREGTTLVKEIRDEALAPLREARRQHELKRQRLFRVTRK